MPRFSWLSHTTNPASFIECGVCQWSEIYTNYLQATDGTGANVCIELHEEGRYEIALDYEILKKDKVVVVDKNSYTDYRIRFSFEVRNGSGMFFLFDTGTGGELEDYSTTENGFRIDLAKSKALSISYSRYALNQRGTGLDARESRTARDNQEFAENGYYEISVTNNETGAVMTKHIFVGDEQTLTRYLESGDMRMDGFR